MNCGRSSSVEWKLPKLQRRVRFPSPAPAPPGHAPGGFVMPTSHPPSTECGGQSAQHFPRASWGPRFRYKTHPARGARCHFRYKTHPTRATRRHFRYKTHPASPKSPNLARFALAGRVLSRFCCQQAEHGEFSPAQTPAPPQARKKQHPPHNTRNHAMKYYPPPLHTQHHTMKHLPPQHATNNQNSATFTMQGRTFFHNTHHTPTPGRHFFQPTPLPAK